MSTAPRRAIETVLRYGVGYPALGTIAALVVARQTDVSFETVLFSVFAVAVVVTGFGAMSGPSSGDALRHAGVGTVSPGEQWTSSFLVKAVLFEAGLAVVLTLYTFVWLGA